MALRTWRPAWGGFAFWVGLLLVVGLGAGLGTADAHAGGAFPPDDDREPSVKLPRRAWPSFYGGYVAGPLVATIDGRTHRVRVVLSLASATSAAPGTCEIAAYPGQASLDLWDARTSRLLLHVESWSFDPKEASGGGDLLLRKLGKRDCEPSGVGVRMTLNDLQLTFSRAPEQFESSRVTFEPALDAQIRFRKLSSGEGSR